MLRDIFTNRWFIGGFGFLIVFAVLCYIWSRYDVASFQQQLSSINEVVLQEDKSKRKQKTVHSDGQLVESRKSTENRSKSVKDTSVPTEKTTKQTDTIEKSKDISFVTDSPTSPFGFGPYPEVPADYPFQERLWDNATPEHELLVRVRVKLWKQGTQTKGAKFDMNNGLIYPSIPGVIYVQWRYVEAGDPEFAGRRYAYITKGDPSTVAKWKSSYLIDDLYEPVNINRDIAVPDIKVYELPDGGIDPYKFLDFSR